MFKRLIQILFPRNGLPPPDRSGGGTMALGVDGWATAIAASKPAIAATGTRTGKIRFTPAV